MLITLAGLTAWTEIQRQAGERLATPIALALFGVGAVLWITAMAIRVTIQDRAAGQATLGSVPEIYPPIHRLAGLLHAAHMTLLYVSAMVLGLGILFSGALPSSLGWVGVIGGAVFAVGFVVIQIGLLGMPFLALAYPCAIGVLLWLRAGQA